MLFVLLDQCGGILGYVDLARGQLLIVPVAISFFDEVFSYRRRPIIAIIDIYKKSRDRLRLR